MSNQTENIYSWSESSFCSKNLTKYQIDGIKQTIAALDGRLEIDVTDQEVWDYVLDHMDAENDRNLFNGEQIDWFDSADQCIAY
jgi:hypothetical protein